MQELQSPLTKQAVVPKFRGRHRIWTDEEVQYLQFNWGAKDLGDIAKVLARTPEAIVMKARNLQLGSAARGVMSLKEFSRKSGYSVTKIRAAAAVLGLKLHRARRSEAWQKRHITWFGISDEHQEELLKYMLDHEVIHKVPERHRGVWGEGKKPPACLKCARTSKPHYAKGLCAGCYQAGLKEQKLSKTRNKNHEGKINHHGKDSSGQQERRCGEERGDDQSPGEAGEERLSP